MNTKFTLFGQCLCLLLLSVMVFIPGITKAQSAYPECGTVYDLGKTGTFLMRPDPNTSCGSQSDIFESYFMPKETYIPYVYFPGVKVPPIVTKKVKIRFMVQDPGTIAKRNFRPGDEPILRRMVERLNSYFQHTLAPSNPQTNICGPCHIPDTRIQVELAGIGYFQNADTSHPIASQWQDTSGNWSVSYNFNQLDLSPHFIDKDSVLNIFLCNFNNGNFPDGTPRPDGYSGIAFASAFNNKYNFDGDPDHCYIILANTYRYQDTVGRMKVLMHELLHQFGLGHVYPPGDGFNETCDEGDPDYLADILNTGSLKDCPMTRTDNNVMAPGGDTWVSPMQMGIIHRESFLGSMRRYTYPTEAPNVTPWLVEEDQTWDFPIRMFQDIRVVNGAILTIKCEVQMPPGGRIVVEPGGKLIVDGGHITSYHQRANWSGIETIGNNTMPVQPQYQGSIELKNGAIIENGSLRNFSWENGAQGGGIIKAANSHFYNCWRAVELNGYGNFSYGTNCLFEKCTFTVDKDASYLFLTGTPTTQFTSFDTKKGVAIRNCSFINEIPYDLHSQKSRGTAIGIAATGATISNSTFEGFRDGIVSNGYTGIPTRNTVIYQNSFNHITNNITLGAGAYGDVRGNTITNMFNYQDGHTVRIGNGIYLDNTKGSYVGCDNSINGLTDGGEWQSKGRAGIIINNSAGGGAIVKRNLFSNLGMATQIRQHNPLLSVHCNQYNNNNIAWLVTGGTGQSLQDQGTGCGPAETRAGNIFSGNAEGIVNYLDGKYKYYAFSSSLGDAEYPLNSSNHNTTGAGVVIYSCPFVEASDPNSQCNQFRECSVMLGRGLSTGELSGLLSEAVSRFRELDGWKSTASEAQVLAGDIVRIYNELDNTAAVQSFLEEASGTLYNDNAYKLLIPLYIETAQYSKAIEAAEGLTLSDRERNAYASYYTIIAKLKIENRRIDALTPEELGTVTALAADSLEVSAFARGLLESGYGKAWEHVIDEEPLSSIPIARGAAAPEQGNASKLGDAVPNPANSKAVIQVYITAIDAETVPTLVLRNLSGKAIASFDLKEGDNTIRVNTRNFAPGLYFYSLVINGSTQETKKLSIIQ